MIRSLYTAATGMLVQQERMNTLVNNITNIETTGFKKDGLVTSAFESILISRIEGTKATAIGEMSLGAKVAQQYTDFSQGTLEQTDRELDLAINGDGYFVISTPNGTMYTRDGNFSVSSDGYLVNNDGYQVMGNGGAIHIGSGSVSVNASGNITVDGTDVGTLRIVAFSDNNSMQKAGNNLYTTTQAALSPADTEVKQGWLEGSNVDMATEIVEMMSVSRAYEINQRVIKMIDETLDKTVNEVGRV